MGLIDNNEVTLDNWTDHLGQASRLLEFRRVFFQGMVKIGKVEFVTQALELMKLALPMGLFHPLIQLSFAVMHGEKKLIANALAYFAIRYKNLYRQYPEISLSESGEISATTKWAEIKQNIDKVAVSFQHRGASLNICEQLCGEKNIQQLALNNGFVINEESLKIKMAEISQMAIRLYLAEPTIHLQ